jgi:gamma-glutamylcyclotransferase (GGCT)/AIG2-like uncharacterized protein YtfP
MQTSHNQLFVYGSLRSDFGHPAYASYISEHFVLLGPARVKGKVYDLGEFPGAVPTSAQDYITGELYRLREGQDFDWAMAQLDDYEGLHENPPLYSRETALVYTPNETTTAWMYWYNQPVDEKARIVSGDVMQYLQEKSNDGKQMNQ